MAAAQTTAPRGARASAAAPAVIGAIPLMTGPLLLAPLAPDAPILAAPSPAGGVLPPKPVSPAAPKERAVITLTTAERVLAAADQAPSAGSIIYDQAKPGTGDATAAGDETPAEGGGTTGGGLEAPTDKAGPLPRLAEPSLYRLKAKLYPDEGRYETSGAIQLTMNKRRASITLHAADMEITRVVFKRAGDTIGTEIDPKNLIWRKGNERVTVPIGPAYEGKAELYLEIKAKLNTQGAGVYLTRDSYKGAVENYVATQFEATDARRFFPMFDEPSYKAKFDLTLDVPSWHTVRSNMPPKRETIVGDRKVVEFLRTPRMASYLFSFVSGRFDYISGKSDGVDVRVYGHPDQVKRQGRLALQAEKKFIRWGGRYFGVRFPLPKHDMIALADFTSGAMENWGMNTFRKESLLYDPQRSAATAEERVLLVVSHENAHSWFGDLVTMLWWDGLWLNEAFANYMESKALDRYYPKVGIWTSVETAKQAAMRVDELIETRGVHSPVLTEAEIDSIFDAITYEKGGAILQMLDHYVTLPVFKKGVQLYMKRHAYKNATLEDLWKAIADASQNPHIVDIGTKWVTQKGFPIVNVESTGDTTLKLSQRRFMANGSASDPSTWPIPMVISYQLKGEAKIRTHRVVFDQRETALMLPGKGELLWVNANAGQTGFYRSALGADLQGKLLNNGLQSLSAVEKIGMINDLWARARVGDIKIGAYLDALAKFEGEEDHAVLTAMQQGLETISDKFLKTDAERKALGRLVRRLVGAQWKAWGWEKPGDDNGRKRARAVVAGMLGRFDADPALVRAARNKLDRYLKDPASIDPNIAMPILEIGARNGDRGLFNDILAAYKRADVADQKSRLLAALVLFRDPALIQEALNLTFAKDRDAGGNEFDVVRGQDLAKPLGQMLLRPDSQAETYQYVVSHWTDTRTKAGSKGSERIIQSLAGVWDAPTLAHMKGFFPVGDNREPRADRSFKQTVEFAENGLAFKAASAAAARDWLLSAANR